MLTDADVLVIENAKVGMEELADASSLKLIHTFGLMADNIDHDGLPRQGVRRPKLDRHSNRMVAEHVMMLMLALARGLDGSREGVRREVALQPSGWAYNWPACQGINGLTGRTVGLVGLGQVGGWLPVTCSRSASPYFTPSEAAIGQRKNELGISYATSGSKW